uniref:Uncharacterized protein n=1 Tax=Oryza glumipatula TaxID=40148 RepID=A0A0E0BPH0_9ORYZ
MSKDCDTIQATSAGSYRFRSPTNTGSRARRRGRYSSWCCWLTPSQMTSWWI